ncbi:MAG: hypothetical protein Q4C26_03180 [Bacteroidales bacterium]|nr:hypothetical protein [Bacteroidales bacterium]
MRRMMMLAFMAVMVSCGTRKALMRQRETLNETAAVQKREMERMRQKLAVVESEVKAVTLEMQSSRGRDSSAVTVRIEEEYDTFASPDNPPVYKRTIQIQGVNMKSMERDSTVAAAGSVRKTEQRKEEDASVRRNSTSVTDTVKDTDVSGKAVSGLQWWQSTFLYIGVTFCLYALLRLFISVFKQRSNGILTTIKKIFKNG